MATKSDFIVKSGIRVAANATIGGSLSVNTAYLTGSIGIGTNNPTAKLFVFDTSSSTVGLGTSNYTYLLNTVDDGSFIIRRNDGVVAERMRISASGNIGIGTNNPTARLSVYGTTGTSQQIRIDGTSDASSLKLHYNGAEVGFLQTYRNAEINFGTVNTAPLMFYTNNVERMRLSAIGYLGIGTASPSAPLHVVSTSTPQIRSAYDVNNYTDVRYDGFNTVGGSQAFYIGGSEKMRLDTGGYLGIGATPSSRLHIRQPADGNGIRIDYPARTGFWKWHLSGVTSEGFAFVQNDGSTDAFAYIMGRNEHYWYTNNTLRMTLNSTGNFGIGNTSPSHKLRVEGTTSIAGNTIPSANVTHDLGTSELRWKNVYSNAIISNTGSFGGNVTIDSSLTVSGNLTISGNVTVIGANNLSVVDNFIYLNSNNTTQNIDIGFAGNYNDGTYRHTGFFRDASDGYYKIFDNYEPEPDANVNIDTANSTFRIANFWSDTNRLGNTTLYATINSSSYSLDSTSYKHSGGNLVLVSGSTDRVIVAANGNVGIGNSTPTARLDLGVYGGGTSLRVQDGWTDVVTSGFVTGTRYIYGVTNYGRLYSDFYGFNIDTSNTSVPIIIGTNGSERMRIAANGNVGIGTATPGVKLDVTGSARLANNSFLYWFNHDSTTNGPSIRGYNDNLNVESGPNGPARGALTLTGHNNTTLQTDGGALLLSASQTSAAGAYINFSTAGSDRMRIANNGNVGIGTVSPAYKLDVTGTARVKNGTLGYIVGASGELLAGEDSGGFYFAGGFAVNPTIPITYGSDGTTYQRWYTSSGEKMRLDASGHLAIGRTDATYQLDMYKVSTSNYARITSGAIQLLLGSSSSLSGGYVGTATNYPLAFFVNDTERMRIAANGNIGIGTTSPQSKLDVAISSSANSFVTVGGANMGVGRWAGIHFGYREDGNTLYRKSAIVFERTDGGGVTNASGKVHILNGPAAGSGSATLADSKLTIDEFGNLGIGTTTPTAKLDVNGSGKFASNTANASIYINNNVEITTNSNNSTVSTSNTIITSFSTANYRGGKFIIMGKRQNDSHMSEVLVTHNNLSAFYNEYGMVYTNTSLYTVSASIVSGNVQIVVTSSFDDMNYDIIENRFVHEQTLELDFTNNSYNLLT